MEKRFKLNKAPYGKSDTVLLSCKYDKKNGGYCAKCELIETNILDDTCLYGKSYCPEYYKSGGDLVELVVSAGRQSEKKKLQAEQIITERGMEFVNFFIEHISMALGIVGLELINVD